MDGGCQSGKIAIVDMIDLKVRLEYLAEAVSYL